MSTSTEASGTDKPIGEMSREELNALATSLGIAEPAAFANKAALVAAIEAAGPSVEPLAPEVDDLDHDPGMTDTDPSVVDAGQVADGALGGGRTESFEATRPNGERVQVTRNLETGVSVVASIGVPMLPGDPREPVGPEDALGVGPTRGDYRDRIGSGSYHPHTGTTAQRPFAEEIGDVEGRKGGVDTGTGPR